MLSTRKAEGVADILYDQCSALAAGSGLERWSCGYDIPDAGDVARMTVRDSEAVDCWQDGFHLDGSWDDHRQIAKDVLFERCRASWNGHRSGTKPAELYQSGFMYNRPGSSTARPTTTARPGSSARTRSAGSCSSGAAT